MCGFAAAAVVFVGSVVKSATFPYYPQIIYAFSIGAALGLFLNIKKPPFSANCNFSLQEKRPFYMECKLSVN